MDLLGVFALVAIILAAVLILRMLFATDSKSDAELVETSSHKLDGPDDNNDDVVSIIDPISTHDLRRQFRSVFAMMTEERRAALVLFYQKKHVCDEREAMRIAIADRQNDEERFR